MMKYALQIGEIPIYQTDEDGNVIYYEDSEGNQIPLETGETEVGYSEPVGFMCGISGRLSEVLIEAFGINDTSLYAQMDYIAGEFPFEVGTLIWKKSEVKYKDEAKTRVDPLSSDYEIAGILDEYQNQWSCLLKRVLK